MIFACTFCILYLEFPSGGIPGVLLMVAAFCPSLTCFLNFLNYRLYLLSVSNYGEEGISCCLGMHSPVPSQYGHSCRRGGCIEAYTFRIKSKTSYLFILNTIFLYCPPVRIILEVNQENSQSICQWNSHPNHGVKEEKYRVTRISS
ncbi:hypothetical protein Pfo_022160 [Paulownia fortunei]|nr:hypothetical protein Pfo_022160 [Paulownia fortunei]